MTREWKPGVNHVEYWVSDLERSRAFFAGLFELLGWKRLSDNAFSAGDIEIYLATPPSGVAIAPGAPSFGARHLCFQATSRAMVDAVGAYLVAAGVRVARGPKEMPYSEGYYTVDFADHDGSILEVAHTPNMKM
jgi:catechol 2,3-dioxygenase-like lactoylglutathione lyase family enzyme